MLGRSWEPLRTIFGAQFALFPLNTRFRPLGSAHIIARPRLWRQSRAPVFPGIHTIFRRNPCDYIHKGFYPFWFGDSCFGFGFWVKRIRTFQRNAAPTLAPPMREPLWRGRYRKPTHSFRFSSAASARRASLARLRHSLARAGCRNKRSFARTADR